MKIAALLHRLRAGYRYHQAQYQHHMNQVRLASVRRELAGLTEVRKELLATQIEAMIDLDASAARVKRCGHARRAAKCVQ